MEDDFLTLFITQRESGEADNPSWEEGSHNYVYTKFNLRMGMKTTRTGKRKKGGKVGESLKGLFTDRKAYIYEKGW